MISRYNGIERTENSGRHGGTNTMPRTSRLIISDQKAVYHVMSRTALDGFPLEDLEKDFMLALIKRFSA
jgi:hypothetical protein